MPTQKNKKAKELPSYVIVVSHIIGKKENVYYVTGSGLTQNKSEAKIFTGKSQYVDDYKKDVAEHVEHGRIDDGDVTLLPA